MAARKKGDLARFNMPFELGVDLGCRAFGGRAFSRKKCLIFEKERYRFAKSLSDLAGVDVRAHNEDPEEMVHQVRHWICNNISKGVESGTKIWNEFMIFSGYFKEIMKSEAYRKRDIDEMEPGEYVYFVKKWMEGK